MAEITEGTVVRLLYQIDLWDTEHKVNITCDYDREFTALDRPDVTERGWHLCVVENDEYNEASDDEVIENCMIITDPNAIEIVYNG
jgi:hypothetical protein